MMQPPLAPLQRYRTPCYGGFCSTALHLDTHQQAAQQPQAPSRSAHDAARTCILERVYTLHSAGRTLLLQMKGGVCR